MPPPAPREFRAAWVATVANIDWPSKPGLPVRSAAGRADRASLDRAARSDLNAIILQVRPAADALYASTLEPWSEYLTGEQGRAPEPVYDPLAFVDRGGAPARPRAARLVQPRTARATRRAKSRARAATTSPTPRPRSGRRRYGDMLWLDPGERAAAQRTLAVILDVVRRYDVDGVHIDDYFYPYPVKVPGTADDRPELDFPDEPPGRRTCAQGGTLARDDWRRAERRTADRARCTRASTAKSPGCASASARSASGGPIAARRASRASASTTSSTPTSSCGWPTGWLDYLAPQLYWPIDAGRRRRSPVLLDYWQRENTRGRHIWPGLFTSRIDDTPQDVAARRRSSTRWRSARTRGATGHIHFSMAALRDNRKGVTDQLAAVSYATPALAPATPWLSKGLPPRPARHTRAPTAGHVIELRITGGAWLLAVWARYGADWRFSVIRRRAARGFPRASEIARSRPWSCPPWTASASRASA